MPEREITFHFKSRLTELTERGKAFLANALYRAGLMVEGKAKRKVPVDTGFLRASIHTKQIDWNHVRVGTSMAQYAAAVEFGSKPHTPPFEPIREWARRHGIEEAAYPILLKIQREGTPAQPYMRPALLESQERITKMLITAQRRAARDLEKKGL